MIVYTHSYSILGEDILVSVSVLVSVFGPSFISAEPCLRAGYSLLLLLYSYHFPHLFL
jgi:hypothetical protein